MEKNKIMNAHQRAQQRKKHRIYNNLIELIEIFAIDYLKFKSSITILSPFGGKITIGKFDNSGRRALQLKLSSSGGVDANSSYPGTNSKGKNWMVYNTWCHHLDKIDSIDRDYLLDRNFKFFNFTKASQIKNHDDFELLIAEIDEISENLELEGGKNNETKKLKKLTKIATDVENQGTLKKQLAQTLIDCLSWPTTENKFSYDKIHEIPDILNLQIIKMQDDLNLKSQSLQPLQSRAADSLFFVSLCENFRVSGALKYMRSCLRYLINHNLTFKEVFHVDITKTICTLSPKGGTKITRMCIEDGNFTQLNKKQKRAYEELSDASEDEDETFTATLKK